VKGEWGGWGRRGEEVLRVRVRSGCRLRRGGMWGAGEAVERGELSLRRLPLSLWLRCLIEDAEGM